MEHRLANGHWLCVFILAVAILFVFTRMTLSESRSLGEEIDNQLVPSLNALEGWTKLCPNQGSTSITGFPIKVEQMTKKGPLKRVVNQDFGDHLTELKSLDGAWSSPARRHLDSLETEVGRLNVVYKEIMRLLADFKSYDDPLVVMEAEGYAMEGAEVAYHDRKCAFKTC